jgi:hypothetical protein
MPLILQSRVYRVDLKANPGAIYAFGDNCERIGYGGQAAEMRDEPNAVGIATLWGLGEFFDEARSADQCAVIDADMEPLFEALRQGRIVVFPLDGVGTGIADLATRSPTTFAHLQQRIEALKQTGLSL